MKNLNLFENFSEERNSAINEAKAEKNLLHQLLGINKGKNIKDVYSDSKKLAKDLVEALKKDKRFKKEDIGKKATSMLFFAGNLHNDGENSVFDKAENDVKDFI